MATERSSNNIAASSNGQTPPKVKRPTARAVKPAADAPLPQAVADDIKERQSSAVYSNLQAVSDVVANTLANSTDPNTSKIARKAVKDLVQGWAPDDRSMLLKALQDEERDLKSAGRVIKINSDDILSDKWRDGAYPYKHLMQRKTYEEQKYRLQVELLKLQNWVKDTGQRVVILFEGRDAAGKGAPSNGLWSILIRVVRAWLRWKSRPKWSVVNGIFSAIFSICPARAKS